MSKRTLLIQELYERGVSCVSCKKKLTNEEISKIPSPINARGDHLNASCPRCTVGPLKLDKKEES